MCPNGDDSSADPRHSTPKQRGTLNVPLPIHSPYHLRSRPSTPEPQRKKMNDELRALNLQNSSTLPTPSLNSPSSPRSQTFPTQVNMNATDTEELYSLHLEVTSLRLEISALRQRYEVEQRDLQKKVNILRLSVMPPNLLPTSQPTPEPASQPIQHPAPEPVLLTPRSCSRACPRSRSTARPTFLFTAATNFRIHLVDQGHQVHDLVARSSPYSSHS